MNNLYGGVLLIRLEIYYSNCDEFKLLGIKQMFYWGIITGYKTAFL